MTARAATTVTAITATAIAAWVWATARTRQHATTWWQGGPK